MGRLSPGDEGRELLTALVDTAAAGDTAVVAAPSADRRIYVVSYVLAANGAVQVRWRSNVTPIGNIHYFAAGSIAWPQAAPGRFLVRTAAGQALNINLSAAIAISVQVGYYLGA